MRRDRSFSRRSPALKLGWICLHTRAGLQFIPFPAAGPVRSDGALADIVVSILDPPDRPITRRARDKTSRYPTGNQKVREIRAKQELLVATLRNRSRTSRVRYAGGIDPLLNALDAERDLFGAEQTLVQTRRNELLTVVQLYRALGGGWQG
jgi:hypothetical protein